MQDRGTAGIQRAVPGGALAAEIKIGPGLFRVSIGLPAAAAGVVPTPVFNEAHYIRQGIAQKQANLMGIVLFQTEPAGQLLQQKSRISGFIAAAFQKEKVFFV